MRKELGMAVALAAMCVALSISNADFYGQSNVVNTTRQIAMLGVLAMGVSFVIITGGIDLSVGSIVGLTGVIIARISAPEANSGAGLPVWLGIAVAMAVALLIGLCQGLLITRLDLQPFIVTLGGMLLIRGVSHTVCGGGNISLGNIGFLDFGSGGLFGDRVPYPAVLFLVVAVVAAYVLHFTVFGRHVYAIGGNRDAARYSGIQVRRVETLVYVISAGLAGLAGIAYCAYINQMSQQVGEMYELLAIASAVLGGCSLRGGEGTVVGVFIGTAILKVIENGINMFKISYTDAGGALREWHLSDTWRNVIIGGVILGAVVLDQVTHIVRDRRRRKGGHS
jgi:ribose transport system permease protein